MLKYDFILKKVITVKKILILSEDNSSCAVIAQGLINRYLNGIKAYSSTINPNRYINLNTKKVLESISAWSNLYYPNKLDDLKDIEFNLVVTICETKNNLSLPFPKKTEVIAVPFQEPKDNNYNSYKDILKQIKEKLLPIVRKKLS